MRAEGEIILERLIEGDTYLWLKRLPGKEDVVQEVVFLRYRPHPGEVIVSCNGKLKCVLRRYLYPANPPGTVDRSGAGSI